MIGSLKAYCIFCKTGSEKVVAQRMNIIDSSIKAFAPVRVLQEKRNNTWEQRDQLLIPGYVFVYAEDVSFDVIKAQTDVYKILEYQNGARELRGSDYEYAAWIYKHDGRIAPSKALFEGSTVKVVDGPLMDGIGTIIKIDRHKRRAWVEFDFDGNKHKVSLSVIDLTSCEL